jgi:hypothetical protein
VTIYIRDTREGIEVYAVSVGGVQLNFACGTRLSAYDLMRLSQAEGVYINAKENE